MIEAMFTTAVQTAVLFVLMGFGVLARRLEDLGPATIRQLTEFLVKYITPCLIVSSFQRPFEADKVSSFVWVFVVMVVATLVGMALAHLFIKNKDDKQRKTLRWACIFSNCGYMGIPLEEAIFGAEGVFYGISGVAVFNIFAWTYGVWLMGGAVGWKGFLRGIVNPANIAILIALPLFFLPWRLPFVISEPIRAIGSLNTPVAMVVMGYYLASAKFAAAFRCTGTYGMLAIRHFAVPAILIGILMFCPFINTTARLASIIPAAAPIGALLTVFAVKYDTDAEFSTALVATSTIFSVATIPLVIAVATVLFKM